MDSEQIRVVAASDAVRLHLEGTVGIFAVDALHAAAKDALAAGADVAVHCGAATHLDCSALQVLLALREAVRAAGRGFALEAVPETVLRYLRLAGLTDLIADGASPAAATR